MRLFDLFYFCKPLYMGGAGGGDVGDGGAADRQAAEDKRVADAVKRVNEIFGVSNATANPINKSDFTKNVPIVSTNTNSSGIGFLGGNNQNNNLSLGNLTSPQPQTQPIFDAGGYNAAVSAEDARVKGLQSAGTQREKLYSTIATDTTNNLQKDLNKERGITDRDLGFNLARSGLTGGSRDIDSHRDVLDTYNQGILKASNLGTQAGNNARVADDNTRTDLITKIRAGLDQGSAIQQSGEAMRNNAARIRDDANNQSLVGFFGNVRNELDRAQYNQGLQQASNIYQRPIQGPINKPAFNGTTQVIR